MQKVILIKNAVETLGYFSEQMAEGFAALSAAVYFVDYDRLFDTVEGLYGFVEPGNTTLVTFNFIGLSGEEVFFDAGGGRIWERLGVRIFNILVDHPMYFHSRLKEAQGAMRLFCVDREHVTYVRRFYPGYEAEFLPLAGNVLRAVDAGEETAEPLPYESRSCGVVFTANYVPLAAFRERMRAQGAEYERFYRNIAEDLLEHPRQSTDAVLERHITEEFGNLSGDTLREAMAGCAFLDMYVRSFLRGELVRELAERGIEIHVFGADWDKLSGEGGSVGTRRAQMTEHIVWNGKLINSAACVRAVGNAKLSLNVLPWFRDGAHDRIFTAMLQKTPVLTDESRFLREEFTDGREIVFYGFGDAAALAERIRDLTEHPKKAKRIAECGYAAAVTRHTWAERARTLFLECS